MRTNLLAETLEVLSESDKAPEDVLWVGSRDGKRAMSWKTFAAIADFSYDSGFGGQEIASDLVVVGSDWWLERGEYDGSEWWEFRTRPELNHENEGFTSVRNGYSWATIEEMNRPGGKHA